MTLGTIQYPYKEKILRVVIWHLFLEIWTSLWLTFLLKKMTMECTLRNYFTLLWSWKMIWISYFFIFLGAVTSSTSSASASQTASAASAPVPAATEQRNDQQPPAIEWHEFSIPPLWKRIVAEIIDFFILFILKLVVTYIAVDWFSLIDVDRYKI